MRRRIMTARSKVETHTKKNHKEDEKIWDEMKTKNGRRRRRRRGR